LDIAAGSGVWSIAFAQEFRSATVTALDFPAVLKVARAYAGKFGVGHRFKYLSGDLRRLDFGKQQHDLIILGHICHSEGRANTIRLLRKSYAALRKDGQVLIADFLPNNRRTGPVMPLMFALNMLLNTTEGDVFSVAEYQKWLRAAGFKKIELLRSAPAPSPLILAAK
ncbi:MAG: methyltransferase domain-containing protein, partial [Lentisphaerae bacterium]|nr:methyltransferase domain-containing protein [Lentisphaerota bacterium]